jgi:hypothetical protein
MNRPESRDSADPQREALRESEKDASVEQPQNFKDAETDAKVVEILPIEPDNSAAIQGIDPDKKKP